MADGRVIEADSRLDELLIDMERFGSVVVTRGGQPVARLVPEVSVRARDDPHTNDVVERFRAFRKGFGDRRFPWGELRHWRDDGRR